MKTFRFFDIYGKTVGHVTLSEDGTLSGDNDMTNGLAEVYAARTEEFVARYTRYAAGYLNSVLETNDTTPETETPTNEDSPAAPRAE